LLSKHIAKDEENNKMKIRNAIPLILLFSLLMGCQAGTPEPITAATDSEITLSIDQTVSLSDANLSITLLEVLSDERCPSEVECAASGPVTLRLSILGSNGMAIEEILQTFTDNNGLAPTMEFEGIKSSSIVDEYQIRLLGVSPYPKNLDSSIKPSEYKVTLKVSNSE
jgi:hypothetical protein